MSSCPTLSDLKRLLLGRLPESERVPLEEHFLGCESCVARAQTLSQDDTLTEALRSSSSAEDEAEKDVIERLIGQARRLAGSPHTEGTVAHDPNLALNESAAFTSFLAPSQAPDEIGRLGPYRVLKVLGHGGMGVVFQAHDPQADRQIALKVMLPQMAAKPDARDRFLREARTTAAIEHDHIVPLYQVAEDRGVPFLAMPLLKGASLEDWLTHRPNPKAPVELPRLLRLGREIALGLAAAHERGLIHRDIKPANIWLDAGADDRVKILDFGLARPVEANANLTQPGMIVGTASYMAPEQARGESVDGRADLYSLGCILYRFCTGRLPFTGPDVMAVLIAASTQPAKPVAELNPNVPRPLADLVMQLLAKDAAARPASARDAARTLQGLERRHAPADDTLAEPTFTDRIPAAPRRKRGALIAAAVVLLVGGGLLAALLSLPKTNPDQAAAPTTSETKPELATGPSSGDEPDPEPAPIFKGTPFSSRFTPIKDKKEKILPFVGFLDEKEVLFVSADAILVHEVVTGQLRFRSPLEALKTKYSSGGVFDRAALSRDGRLLALARHEGDGVPVVLWDVKERKEIGTFPVPDGRVSALAFHPDGTRLATAGRDPIIRLWDVKTRTEVGKLEGHTARVNALAYSPDGTRLASGCDGNTLRLWDVAARKQFLSIPYGTKGIVGVSYSPNGRAVAATSLHSGAIFASISGKKNATFASYGALSPAFSPDGKSLLTPVNATHGREGYRLYVFEAAAGRLQKASVPEHTAPIMSVAFSPDGRTVASTSRDGTAKLWEITGSRSPLDEAWLKMVANLPAEKQAEEVLKELKKRNPGFEATVAQQKAAPNGNLQLFRLVDVAALRDITPLRALKDLESLWLRAPNEKNCDLEDLSPLADLKKLRHVTFEGTNIRDLTPLKDLTQLEFVHCTRSPLSDLAPLKDRKIKTLIISFTKVDRFDALADQRDLYSLTASHLNISDLTPLRSLSKLTVLDCAYTDVEDLTPIKDLPIKELVCPPEAVAKNADLLLKMSELRKINGKTVADAIKEAGKK